MFKDCRGAHAFEKKLAFIGYHAVCLAVKKLAIQLTAVAEYYKDVRSFAKVVVQHS